MRYRKTKAAFTLIETILVIAILGIIAGLLLSAVQKVRETANRAACANNLRQIGIAMTLHHDTFGLFPSNGGWDGEQSIVSTTGMSVFVTTTELPTGNVYNWGVGKPGLSPPQQTGSWAFSILPFMEQEASYKNQEWQVGCKSYTCPSRRTSASQVPMNDQYGTYEGGGWRWGKTDYAANSLLVPNRPTCHRLAEVTDGASNTIGIGEKSLNPGNYTTGGWFWDEPYFAGGSGGTQRRGVENLPDSTGMGRTFAANWGSAHASGAQFLFVDGAIHLLGYNISPITLEALLTINGHEEVPTY